MRYNLQWGIKVTNYQNYIGYKKHRLQKNNQLIVYFSFTSLFFNKIHSIWSSYLEESLNSLTENSYHFYIDNSIFLPKIIFNFKSFNEMVNSTDKVLRILDNAIQKTNKNINIMFLDVKKSKSDDAIKKKNLQKINNQIKNSQAIEVIGSYSYGGDPIIEVISNDKQKNYLVYSSALKKFLIEFPFHKITLSKHNSSFDDKIKKSLSVNSIDPFMDNDVGSKQSNSSYLKLTHSKKPYTNFKNSYAGNHVYQIYFKNSPQSLWVLLYEDNFTGVDYLKQRDLIINALKKLEYQYKIEDYIIGVYKDKQLENENILICQFDKYASTEFSKSAIIYINYLLSSFKLFFPERNNFQFDQLFFETNDDEFVDIIRAYQTFKSGNIFTESDKTIFGKMITSNFINCFAYLFYEYSLVRIERNLFSGKLKTELTVFFSVGNNTCFNQNESLILDGIFNSAKTLQTTNAISIESNTNLLKYEDYFLFLLFANKLARIGIDLFSLLNEKWLDSNKLFDKHKLELESVFFSNKQFDVYKNLINKHILLTPKADIKKELSITNSKSVFSSLIEYDLIKKKLNLRRKKLITSVSVISVVSMTIGLNLYNNYRESLFTTVTINQSNYGSFFEYTPILTRTSYFMDSNSSPTKYLYSLDITFNNFIDQDFNPSFKFTYSTPSNSYERFFSESYSFESTTLISEPLIRINPSYSKTIKLLKSSLNSLNVETKPTNEYMVQVQQSDYRLRERTISLSNYSAFLTISISAPVDTTRNGSYVSTSYKITISKKSNVVEVFNTSVAIKYNFSNSYISSSTVTHIVYFTYTNQTKSDSFGDYPYYTANIHNVTGRVLVRE
jgi:hypothetical protein